MATKTMSMTEKLETGRKRFFAKLPKRITCTKCEKNRNKDQFGVRLMNRNEVDKGKPAKFLRQSYCNDCRHE